MPEPLGDHRAFGFRESEVARARFVGLSRLSPTERVTWSFTRPKRNGDLWRAARLGLIISGSLFAALTILGTMELTPWTIGAIGLLGLVASITSLVLWKAIRASPRNLVPGFVAILTNQRLLVVNLDSPEDVWSLYVGQVLQVSSDTLLHAVGGVWVAGCWLDPRGRRVETKVPLFIGRECAATIQMLRRRLTAECLDESAEAA
ncbi:MAG: hypothetical protein ACOYN0_03965 [Phycisphaerales bacterium]